MNKQKILIITATHGDEDFSIPLVKKLSSNYEFDWIVANKRALRAGKRYINSDLNRSGPGRIDGLYEERRAYQIIKLASKYNSVIDIHGTTSQTGLFIILSDPCWKNIEFSKEIDLKKTVLWPSLSETGPLTQFIPRSLEIECGPKDNESVGNQLYRTLEKFLNNIPPKIEKEYFIVSGKFKEDLSNLREFQKHKSKNEIFYPLMINQYTEKEIKCYKMQKLSDTL